VSQGEHVALMFPMIFNRGLEIGFAYTSFKWENNAKRNAGVTVVVINLRNKTPGTKYIFTNDIRIEASSINGYLADGPSVFIGRRKAPIDGQRPPMVFGSMPRDGGGLILTRDEYRTLAESFPEAKPLIKRYTGSAEYIGGVERYCLWIEDRQENHARAILPIGRRLDAVAKVRAASKAASTAKYAEQPYRFVQISYRPTDSIIVPSVSSERREYIPIGYLDHRTVISNLAFAVYGAEPWVFALLTSRLHMVWTRSVGGQLETRIRYSNTIVYNNFPVPTLASNSKENLTSAALRVLDVREYHSEKTLEQLYDPDLMPDDLRLAHQELDMLVDSTYRKRPFNSDEERLSHLFAMYEEMTRGEVKK
jgi:hypothetical protein